MFSWLDQGFQDVGPAIRTFRRNRLLTATAIVCLALGIGTVTAMFSAMYGVLLRTLPYPDADRLVVLRTQDLDNSAGKGRVSEAELRDWQAAAKSFEQIAGYRWMTIDLVESERSERIQGLFATPEYFQVFGVQPSAGRAFQSNEPPGIVLGANLWERRFASDSSVVGRTIPVGICCPQKPQTANVRVVGAVDRDIPFPPTMPAIRDRGHGVNDVIDYWFPVYVNFAKRSDYRGMEAVGKLKLGVTLGQAQSEMDAIARQLEQDFPETNRGWTIRVVPIADEVLAGVRPILYLLMVAAAFVLLIACGNVAVLLTFNAIRRLHDIAVRAALGAGAGRLIRQFGTESIFLTLCGGVAGWIVAIAVKRFLITLAPANLPRLNQISLDTRVFGFALATTIACGIIVGLIPVLRVLKFDIEASLRAESSRNATSHRRARTYEPLVVLQVALTLALLIGSGLMARSVYRLLEVSPGFQTPNLITTTLSLPSAKHAWSYNARFSERVLDHIRALPTVAAAAGIRGIPMSEVVYNNRYWLPGQPRTRMAGWLIRLRVVSRDYFNTMGIPMLSGRDFQPQDEIGEIGNTKVIIVNQTMAQLVWPGRNPVGEKVISEVEPNNAPVEVIGVVGDVRYTALDSEPVAEAYYPQGLYPQDEFSIVIRTASAPGAMAKSVRAAVNEVERDVFITPFRTLDDVISTSLDARRFAMLLLSVFTAAGMLLAVIGIAGIVAYSSSLRMREVGIRVAMGAVPCDVIALISRQGIAPAVVGIALGLLIAVNLTRFLGHMLYTVSPYDPTVFGSATAALALISVLVAGIAAYRACRVDASSLLK